VRRVITVERMVEEMDLELSRFLEGRQRLDAVRVLEFVRGREGVNQKEVSRLLGLAEAYVSRLTGRLEVYGYLGRRRGRRKEWIIESSLDIR
jgi:DNA-binding MarR family transcriptional regulator